MKLTSLFSVLISMLYTINSHPVLLMALIMTQTSILCVVGWLKLKISWFSYILFLIFLGGLMVLFIYITSLASNEKFNQTPFKLMPLAMIFLLASALTILMNNFQITTSDSSLIMIKSFNFMYSLNSLILTGATMVYLLLTLIIVVKISNKFEAPLKNTIFK